nr:VC1465 family Xer recombination activation factor [uncultured Albidiferax sp.]
MQRADVAKYLQVSERTFHNWESGRHVIPFAVYKLLRLLNHMELPGPSWDGWSFHSGKLWSPEGHGFNGKDSSWWSLLVRRAAMFGPLYAENVQLRLAAKGAERLDRRGEPQADRSASRDASGPAMRGGAKRRPNLLLEHFGTQHPEKGVLSEGKPLATDTMKTIANRLASTNLNGIAGDDHGEA